MGLASKIQAAGGASGGAPAGAPVGQTAAPAGYPSQGPPASSGAQGQQASFFPGQQQQQQQQQPRPGQQGAQSSYPGQQGMQQGQQSSYPGQQGGFPGQQGQQSTFPGQQSQQGGYSGQPGQQAGFGSQQQRPQGAAFGQQAGFPGQQGQQGQQGGFSGQQPGQYGQQSSGSQYPAQGAGAGFGQGSAGAQGLQSKIENMVRTNRLEAFYPPQKLQAVLQRLNQTDFKALSQRWNMPLELAYDLATLALYDIVIFADDSGSMIFEEGGERINDLKVIMGRVAEVATLFDEDGIVVRFMNGHVEGNGIRDPMSANNLISQVQFTGMTPLGSSLDSKVIRPFLGAGISNRNLQKPILVITITDGEPTGEPQNTVANVIKNAKNMCTSSIYGPNAIAFEFAQVGKDTKAQAFLGRLDTDPEIGKMIDATSYYELEAEEYMRRGVNLTPELWLVKLMVGAVDPTYDEQDQ
ncbi:TPA: hypothetical protein ACH3X3_010914 [Trebouxia sp. C0006]